MKKYVRHSQNYNDQKKRGKGRFKRPRSWSPPAHLSDYEKSVWLMNSFTGKCVKRRDSESTENLIRRFKKSVENAGVLREVKKREYYMSKSQKKRDKRKRALKRLRKRMKLEQAWLEQEEKANARPFDDKSREDRNRERHGRVKQPPPRRPNAPRQGR